MKRILSIILVSIIMIFSLVGCDDTSSSSNSSLHSGQRLKLSQEGLFCSSKENVDKMLDYMDQKNSKGQNEMISQRKAIVLPKDTEINIRHIGMVTEIETANGEKWFAPSETIK